MNEIIIELDNLKDLKKIIRKNRANNNIKILFKYNDKLYEKKDESIKEYDKYLEVIETFNIKDKRKRLSYIYDNLCTYFDNDMKKNNYCEFCDGTCIANRLKKSVHKDNGCCYKRGKLCEYLTDKGCTNPNPTCKIFMCSYLNKVKKVPNYDTRKILITSCFLNLKGHNFFKTNYFITKSEFIEKYINKVG